MRMPLGLALGARLRLTLALLVPARLCGRVSAALACRSRDGLAEGAAAVGGRGGVDHGVDVARPRLIRELNADRIEGGTRGGGKRHAGNGEPCHPENGDQDRCRQECQTLRSHWESPRCGAVPGVRGETQGRRLRCDRSDVGGFDPRVWRRDVCVQGVDDPLYVLIVEARQILHLIQ
jgi:hypothetical protein